MVRRVAKRQARKGMSLMEPAPEEPQMDYEEDEEDDLADLLEEEPAPEEPYMEEDDESGMALMRELDLMYKTLDERDGMILQLAKATQTLAKRVLALEDDDEDDEEEYEEGSMEYKAAKAKKAAVKKEAPEGDFTVGGDDDLGDQVQQGGETQVPGLTAGQPQGIAQLRGQGLRHPHERSSNPRHQGLGRGLLHRSWLR